jgi:hypothetical protein
MTNSFENKNKDNNKENINHVEETAFFNSDFKPDSQMAKIAELDKIIEEKEDEVKKDQNSQDIDSVYNINAFRKSMELQDHLEEAKYNKNTLIKEGVDFNIENEIEIGQELEGLVKSYPYLDKNESTISKIRRLLREIKKRESYIEDSDNPLDENTKKIIDEDIQERRTKIDNLINSN